jgi:hypothetical protein
MAIQSLGISNKLKQRSKHLAVGCMLRLSACDQFLMYLQGVHDVCPVAFASIWTRIRLGSIKVPKNPDNTCIKGAHTVDVPLNMI